MRGLLGFLGLGAVYGVASGWVGFLILILFAGNLVGQYLGPRPGLTTFVAYFGVLFSWACTIILDVSIVKAIMEDEGGFGDYLLGIFSLLIATLLPSGIVMICFSILSSGTCDYGNDIIGEAFSKTLLVTGARLFETQLEAIGIPPFPADMVEGFC